MMYSDYNNSRGSKRFFIIPLFIIAAALVMGAVVMLLWNAILPYLLNIKAISYWQAVGLLVLCKILFGGFGQRRYSSTPFKRTHWRDKWSTMSDEERIRFKEEWKKRCEQRRSE